MKTQNRQNSKESGMLHSRNPHQGRYDFAQLTDSCPELKNFSRSNPKGDNTIDFSDAAAVLCLNKALLSYFYNIKNWMIPEGYLCPPIPGRADYIHYSSDLLAKCSQGAVPQGHKVHVLDIGTGASCIYPIIGNQSYGWQFVGTDIDPVAVKSARQIVQTNACLKNKVDIIQQTDFNLIFKGIIKNEDRYDLTLCNPPFHSSLKDAEAGNQRKWKNLNKENTITKRNFGGQESELCYPGGEMAMIKQIIEDSVGFARQVCWFTSLVSNGDNVEPLKNLLEKAGVVQIEIISMTQGQKLSRLIAWSFFTKQEQKSWSEQYWS